MRSLLLLALKAKEVSLRILVTGGLGFVGSSLSTYFRERGHDIVALDNLKRRGSELNLPRLKKLGVEFFHADIRQFWDLDSLPGDFDLMIEASAEPSVHAGNDGSPRYVLDTNLNGALNCLEFARKRCDFVAFLSTSRVYSIPHLQSLPLHEGKNGYSLLGSHGQGFSEAGIAENFPIDGYRSLYGSTKLAGEMFLEEYGEAFGLNYVINRCGVLAGPGQFGRVDQGVYTLWVAHHLYGKPLSYTGFGGTACRCAISSIPRT